MEELWYEENLLSSPMREDEKSLKNNERETIKVLIGHVRWKYLGQSPLQTGEPGHLYLVRLRFQFVPNRNTIVYAKCSASLWSHPECSRQPLIYDFYPKNYYEGKPKTVQVQLGPEFRIGGVEVKLGNMSSDLSLGRLFPKVTGYLGENEAKPYWEIYPLRGVTNLEGILDFWLVVETPKNNQQFTIAVMAEATVQGKRRFFVRPEKKAWASRPRVTIGS